MLVCYNEHFQNIKKLIGNRPAARLAESFSTKVPSLDISSPTKKTSTNLEIKKTKIVVRNMKLKAQIKKESKLNKTPQLRIAFNGTVSPRTRANGAMNGEIEFLSPSKYKRLLDDALNFECLRCVWWFSCCTRSRSLELADIEIQLFVESISTQSINSNEPVL